MMLAHIQFEAIGFNQTKLPMGFGREAWQSMPWCAEVVGLYSAGALCLRFLERKITFEESNSKMSRGVLFHFYPETGRRYAAFRRTSWQHCERFWFRVGGDGAIIEIDESEARSWAEKLDWEKTCSRRPSSG